MASGTATDTVTSSSSSALLPPKKNDVFISFRVADIRRQFLSHLRAAFSKKKIKVYTDERIRKSDQIWAELADAIQQSHVAVVIFSKHFASSTWCLRELKEILACREKNKQIVIPVFYNVDPSHVGKQTGTYKNAFDKHKSDTNLNRYEVVERQECLRHAATDLLGWDFKNERNEFYFVQKIVQDVLQKLKDTRRYPNVLEGLVGIEKSYGDVKSLLESSLIEVRKIGIWGMPGIGKTTLANVVFSELSSEYESSCFLPNVREQYEKYGIDCLREKLFQKLLENVDLNIGSAKVGTSFVMSSLDLGRLSSLKVLIVLDDVDLSEQIDYLVGWPICLRAGSRVIITSRDKNELSRRVDDIIEVPMLNSQDSLKLFCSKAFKKVHPNKGYESVSERVVSFANGNPLALTVLGSWLYRKSLIECNTLLTKLQKLPHRKIQHVLKLSYNGMDEFQRNIFLDIACFCMGEDKEDLIKMLNDLYDNISAESEIKALQDKALVMISYKNEVQMHDLIQQMGREIIRQENTENPGCRSRLWDANDVFNVLNNNKGTDAVKSIFFNVSQCRQIDLSPDVFKGMPNVKYLKFYTSYLSDSCNVKLSRDLNSLPNFRFLHWVGFPSKSLPSTFNPENLVELYMPKGHMQKLWGGVQNLVRMKTINLSFCGNLLELPDLSQASKLETLDLSFCSNLVEISSWLKYLNELRKLNLEFCCKLERLPKNTHLLHLEKVNCRGCSNLQEFSLTSGNMVFLSLEGTAIESLPTQIWCLNEVKTMILSSSTRFENFPNIPRFKELHNFDDLWSLERPNRDVPWDLHSLQDLYLNDTNVESLPVGIKYLLGLKRLILKRCNRLRSVPELPPYLSYFCATDCTALEKVARSEFIGDGQTLYYYNCTNLDQTSRNNIIVYAQDRIKRMAVPPYNDYHQPSFWDAWLSVCFPGKDIPDWFNIQKPESSLVLDMEWKDSIIYGFALCVVLGEFQEQYEEINVECRCGGVQISSRKFEEKYFENSQDIPRLLCSEHVFIWYDVNFPTGYFPPPDDGKYSFKFYGPDGKSDLVKKCGIRPLYPEDLIEVSMVSVNPVDGSGAENLDDMETTSANIVGK